MTCNCICREPLVKTTAVAVTGTSPNQKLTLTIPDTVLVENGKFRLLIVQAFPRTAGTLPVEILNGSTSLPVLNRIGNSMRADQIKPRQVYYSVYGADTPHVLIKNHVPETAVL